MTVSEKGNVMHVISLCFLVTNLRDLRFPLMVPKLLEKQQKYFLGLPWMMYPSFSTRYFLHREQKLKVIRKTSTSFAPVPILVAATISVPSPMGLLTAHNDVPFSLRSAKWADATKLLRSSNNSLSTWLQIVPGHCHHAYGVDSLFHCLPLPPLRFATERPSLSF